MLQHGFNVASLETYLKAVSVSAITANNLSLVPEPSTVLLGIGGYIFGREFRRRKFKQAPRLLRRFCRLLELPSAFSAKKILGRYTQSWVLPVGQGCPRRHFIQTISRVSTR